MKRTFVILFLCAFVLANLIVKYFGATGLWLSSFLLIPFDFICRCLFHETWKGKVLIVNLAALTLASGIITTLINFSALSIALASFCGFCAAQIGAGLFYQYMKKKSFLIKVNISDLIAITCDSFVFQFVAFGGYDIKITLGQVAIKFLGGLLWYFILFHKLQIQNKWKN